jgi:hypothetical protein
LQAEITIKTFINKDLGVEGRIPVARPYLLWGYLLPVPVFSEDACYQSLSSLRIPVTSPYLGLVIGILREDRDG